MKDSGVEWIGEIPEDWEVARIGSLYNLRRTIVDDYNYPPLSVTKKGIVPQLEDAAKTNDHNNRKLVKKGDFVINSRSDRKGSCGISKFEGSVSLINAVLEPRDKMNPDYYGWLFETSMFADEFYKWGHGIVDDLWTTNWDDMKKISIPMPNFYEQTDIANEISNIFNKINFLIVNITDEILKLKEYKKSIITEAVTKGLDRDVPMKDSGIEWIGEIPEHWLSSRIQYESWVRARLGWKGLKSEEYTDNGYPLLSAFNIKNDKLDWHSEVKFINKTRFDESPEIKLNIGDVLLLKDGAGIGKCARIDNLPLGESTTNSSLAVITPNKSLDYKYLYYYLLSGIFKNFTNRVLNGMGVPHLTQEEIKKIKIPVPPIKEQKKISDYLDLRTSDIDAILLKKQTQIQNLEEYKKSLIYEYVTGKKEVGRG